MSRRILIWGANDLYCNLGTQIYVWPQDNKTCLVFVAGHTHTFKKNKKKVFMKLLLIFLGILFKSSSNDTSLLLQILRVTSSSLPKSIWQIPTLPMLLGGAPPLRWPQENSSKTWAPTDASEWRWLVHFRGTNPPPWKQWEVVKVSSS